MHLKRVIPCLDVDAGRVVKGTNFVDLRDAGDPVELAERYDAEGADELVFLDITATHEKRDTMVELARRTADNVFIPFTIGGGIRSVADAQAVLDAGADKISVNSAAVARPELIDELADRLGAQCVVLAIDAKAERRASWEVFVAGGRTATGRDAVAWAREGTARGAGEILLTSMDRDGTNDGYDLALTTAVAGAVGAGHRLRRRRHARPPCRGAARRRRRRAVRLDLPLRPPHGGRGQGAPGRGRHRRACVGTRGCGFPSAAASARTKERPACATVGGAQPLRRPRGRIARRCRHSPTRNGGPTRHAGRRSPAVAPPQRGGLDLGTLVAAAISPRWSPPPSSRGSGRRARCGPRR